MWGARELGGLGLVHNLPFANFPMYFQWDFFLNETGKLGIISKFNDAKKTKLFSLFLNPCPSKD